MLSWLYAYRLSPPPLLSPLFSLLSPLPSLLSLLSPEPAFRRSQILIKHKMYACFQSPPLGDNDNDNDDDDEAVVAQEQSKV